MATVIHADKTFDPGAQVLTQAQVDALCHSAQAQVDAPSDEGWPSDEELAASIERGAGAYDDPNPLFGLSKGKAASAPAKPPQRPHKAPWWSFLTGHRTTPAMGRVLLLVAFGIACAAWIVSIVKTPGAFPEGLLETIWALLAYTLGGKFVPFLKGGTNA